MISAFSIFFVPDMERAVAELWRMVKPGGKLAITTWGPDIWEPVYSIWRDVVHTERPNLYNAFNPWDRITQPEQVRGLLQQSGIAESEIVPENGEQPLRSPDDWWTIVLGSGLRGTVDAMDAATATRIREQTVRWTRDHNITAVQTNVIYAIATKPADAP